MIKLVVARYDKPEKLFGVFYSENHPPALVSEEVLDEYFSFGNEVEVTVEELRSSDQIPVQWKHPDTDDEWLLGRCRAYDNITPLKPL